VSVESFYYKRIGDTLYVKGTFTAGTTTGDVAKVTLPTGLTYDTAKHDFASNQTAVGTWFLGVNSTVHGGPILMIDSITDGFGFSNQGIFGATNISALTRVNGNATSSSGNELSINMSIPITNWTATTEHVVTPAKSGTEHARFEAHAGYGSTDTLIPYFTNNPESDVGELISITNNSTNGLIVEALKDCIIDVQYSNIPTTSSLIVGLSLNSSQLTTSIQDITDADIIAISEALVNLGGSVSTSMKLNAGDKIRPHVSAANGESTNGTNSFQVTAKPIEANFLAAVPVQKVAYIKDVKATTVAGGTFTQTAWRTRDLNTIEGDSEIVSLATNQFTLGAGKYQIEATAPGFAVNIHTAKLYNITDSTNDLIGTTARAELDGVGGMNNSVIYGEVEITSSKTYEIQHYCSGTVATSGFGFPNSFGLDEVYTQVKITKLR
jgi:hypothetical protein